MSNIASATESRDTPTTQVRERLTAEIEEAHMAVNALENRLESVSYVVPKVEAPSTVGPDAPGGSEHVRSLAALAERVSSLTQRIRSVISTLEV